jgi:hypothetical protein
MKRLTKIVVQVPLDERYKEIFDIVDRYELLQIHRLDNEIIIATQSFKFKNSSFGPKNLLGIGSIEFVEVISEDIAKNEYVCFVKHHWPSDLKQFFEDTDIIMNTPIIAENGAMKLSFTTEIDKVDKIWAELQHYGDQVKVISVNTLLPPCIENITLSLTDRQREILYHAVEHGYYEIPRKINTSDLAQNFGISQSALSEHLRKIERVVFHSIFRDLG